MSLSGLSAMEVTAGNSRQLGSWSRPHSGLRYRGGRNIEHGPERQACSRKPDTDEARVMADGATDD
jgi:hypothetical protein